MHSWYYIVVYRKSPRLAAFTHPDDRSTSKGIERATAVWVSINRTHYTYNILCALAPDRRTFLRSMSYRVASAVDKRIRSRPYNAYQLLLPIYRHSCILLYVPIPYTLYKALRSRILCYALCVRIYIGTPRSTRGRRLQFSETKMSTPARHPCRRFTFRRSKWYAPDVHRDTPCPTASLITSLSPCLYKRVCLCRGQRDNKLRHAKRLYIVPRWYRDSPVEYRDEGQEKCNRFSAFDLFRLKYVRVNLSEQLIRSVIIRASHIQMLGFSIVF